MDKETMEMWMKITDTQINCLTEMGEHTTNAQKNQQKEIELLGDLIDLLDKRIERLEEYIKLVDNKA